MEKNQLKQEFIKRYGQEANQPEVFFSPGRVNLIGEHTDYNGGYVFPCALSFGTYLAVRKIQEDVVRFASTNFDFTAEVSMKDIDNKIDDQWVNYPLGVLVQLKKAGLNFDQGVELLYYGDIPNGAGLSSSASIEMVTAYAMNILFDAGNELWDLVKMSQAAENQFVGVNCGIMDQFASGMGLKDHALALNCSTLEYEKVPVNLEGYKIVISNTNKRRGLADSKYNERRAECDKAVEYLNKKKPIKELGELTMDQFNEISDAIPDETVKRRARHVVSEDQRVLDAIEALKAGKLEKFGQMMNESHDSLRDDYEVTGIELDTLVEEARKVDGVLGSRMTGAGFGGCTVSIVKEEQVDVFTKSVGDQYERRTSIKPDFYIADISDGSKKI